MTMPEDGLNATPCTESVAVRGMAWFKGTVADGVLSTRLVVAMPPSSTVTLLTP